MKTRDRLTGMVKAARPHAIRLAYCLFIFSFLLPYVDVMGCSTKKIETYHGYQLVRGAPAALYLLAIVLFIAMLALSFYSREITRTLSAFGASWRAMAAAVAGFIIGLLPGVQFLFDGVFMLIGQLLGLACAAAVIIDGLAVSVKEFAVLRKEPSPAAGTALPPALAKLHLAAAVISLALVPLYCYSLRSEVMLAVLYLLFLSLPFVLSQTIVLQGIRRGERWTLWWTPVAAVLLVGATVITVLSLF